MAKYRIQMSVQYRKCKNERSRGYNHYYSEVRRAQPLTTHGLAEAHFCKAATTHLRTFSVSTGGAVFRTLELPRIDFLLSTKEIRSFCPRFIEIFVPMTASKVL